MILACTPHLLRCQRCGTALERPGPCVVCDPTAHWIASRREAADTRPRVRYRLTGRLGRLECVQGGQATVLWDGDTRDVLPADLLETL